MNINVAAFTVSENASNIKFLAIFSNTGVKLTLHSWFPVKMFFSLYVIELLSNTTLRKYKQASTWSTCMLFTRKERYMLVIGPQ